MLTYTKSITPTAHEGKTGTSWVSYTIYASSPKLCIAQEVCVVSGKDWKEARDRADRLLIVLSEAKTTPILGCGANKAMEAA